MELEHIVMLGMPGSGKGTHSQILKEQGYHHLSTGELFRSLIQKTGDSWYNQVSRLLQASTQEVEIINNGSYVNDNAVNDFIKKYLQNYNDKPTIFDGYPRTLEQARYLDSIEQEYIIVYLDVKKSEAERRLFSRSHDSGRIDDASEIIKRRMEIYHKDTLNLIPYYRLSNKRFIRIDTNNDIGSVSEKIIEELRK